MRNVTKAGSRGKDFHMKLFNTILLVLSVTTLNKVLDTLVCWKFLKVQCCWQYFELRSATCVHIVISVLPYLCMHVCEYKIPMGYLSEETNHISVGGKSAGYR